MYSAAFGVIKGRSAIWKALQILHQQYVAWTLILEKFVVVGRVGAQWENPLEVSQAHVFLLEVLQNIQIIFAHWRAFREHVRGLVHASATLGRAEHSVG